MPFYAKLTGVLLFAAALIALLLFFLWYGNNVIRTGRYEVRMPEGFDGFTIAHVSDLHDHRFGKEQKKLLALLEQAHPDIIAITGDIIHNEYTKNALDFIDGAVKLCPVYYVIGNHECILTFKDKFLAELTARGVVVLNDESATVERNGGRIRLIGLADPMTRTDARGPQARREATAEKLAELVAADPEDTYRLLLTHRPEMFEDYAAVDLALAGHAHAGQVRLPFFGAFLTPGEGFHPKYDVGMFEQGDMTMIVSGGLGSSNVVPRIHNRPQLVVVTGASQPTEA